MLKIRLRRMGKRHRPFYRVVVSDSRSVPSAPAVDEIGHYDPMARPPRVRLDLDRVEHWTGHGALLTPSVKKLVKGARTGKFQESPAEQAKAARAKEAEAAAESPAAAEVSAEERQAAAAKEETATATATDEARDAQAAGTEAAKKVAAADEAKAAEAKADEAEAEGAGDSKEAEPAAGSEAEAEAETAKTE